MGLRASLSTLVLAYLDWIALRTASPIDKMQQARRNRSDAVAASEVNVELSELRPGPKGSETMDKLKLICRCESEVDVGPGRM